MNTKITAGLSCLLLATALAGCDLRSDTAKREMEKFSGTPTPTLAPQPTELPIDPSEVIRVNTDLEGEKVTVNGYDIKRSVTCSKFNQVMVSGSRNAITIKGGCRLIMINGDDNQVISDAASEIVVNGDKNNVSYSRFVNGKRPVITDNASGNVIEKAIASGVTH